VKRPWRIPAILVGIVILAVPFFAVVEVPGEQRVKEELGIGQAYGKWPRCGEIRDAGTAGPPYRVEPKLPEGRDEMRAARIGDSIYLIGGLSDLDLRDAPATAKSVDEMWRFDLDTGKYTDMPRLPEKVNHSAAVVWHGDIYVFGGHTDKLDIGEALADAFVYRVAERKWERIASMPGPRGGHGAVVIGDKAYIVGGRSGPRTRLNSLIAYDFRTDSYEELAPMRTARDHLAVGEHDGKVYALGGRQFGDYSLGAFERYDPERDRWEALPDHPNPVSSMSLEWVNGRFVTVAGGHAAPEPAWITGDAWTYDPDAERWGELPPEPVPRHGYAHAVVGDRLYMFGGSACGTYKDVDRVDSLQVPPPS
jgi:Kelch motif/Galactose oxidase, central domain